MAGTTQAQSQLAMLQPGKEVLIDGRYKAVIKWRGELFTKNEKKAQEALNAKKKDKKMRKQTSSEATSSDNGRNVYLGLECHDDHGDGSDGMWLEEEMWACDAGHGMFVKLNSGRVTMETGLNKEQEEALKCVFEIFDEDGSGDIDYGEMKTGMEMMTGKKIGIGAWDQLMRDFDEDGDGEFGFGEFVQFMTPRWHEIDLDRLADLAEQRDIKKAEDEAAAAELAGTGAAKTLNKEQKKDAKCKKKLLEKRVNEAGKEAARLQKAGKLEQACMMYDKALAIADEDTTTDQGMKLGANKKLKQQRLLCIDKFKSAGGSYNDPEEEVSSEEEEEPEPEIDPSMFDIQGFVFKNRAGKKDPKTGLDLGKKARWAYRWLVLKMMAPGEGVDDEGNAFDDDYSPTLAYYDNDEAFKTGKPPKQIIDVRLCVMETMRTEDHEDAKQFVNHTLFIIKTPGRDLIFAVNNEVPDGSCGPEQWLENLEGATSYAKLKADGEEGCGATRLALSMQARIRGNKDRRRVKEMKKEEEGEWS